MFILIENLIIFFFFFFTFKKYILFTYTFFILLDSSAKKPPAHLSISLFAFSEVDSAQEDLVDPSTAVNSCFAAENITFGCVGT